MFVAMTSVLMMTVMGACTIYAAEEGGSAEVNVQTKVSGTAPEHPSHSQCARWSSYHSILPFR